MKCIKTKNKIKTWAVYFAVCLALILSTVFTFGQGGNSVSAAGDSRVADDGNGVRFVRVAAGEDFAIGLTYDGKLFGWSLIGNTTQDRGADSLGKYYTQTPTEINVKFRNGPNGSSKYVWDTNTTYHTTKSDTIVSIAATRNTAAFVTASGYIYTWGKDVEKDIEGGYGTTGASSHYLLLRPETSNDAPDAVWYEPYIIKYDFYESNVCGLNYLAHPNGETFSELSLAGGENNYILVYKNDNRYYSYVWGSILYLTAQTDGMGYSMNYDFTPGSTDAIFNIRDRVEYRKLYRTQYSSAAGVDALTTQSVVAVAGGYNVGMNAAVLPSATNVSSLSLRGKNFITSANAAVDVDGKTITPVATVKANEKPYTTNISDHQSITTDGLTNIRYTVEDNEYVVADAIVGGYLNQTASQEIINGEVGIADLIYARQAVSNGGTGNLLYGVTQVNSSENTAKSSGVRGSDGEYLDGIAVVRNAVSLGNDIGYGISFNSTSNKYELYAWGDNSQGQSGLGKGTYYQYPTPTLTDKGSIISVAAGKQTSPAKDKKAFSAANTLTVDTSGETPVASFGADFKNGDAYISGAVNDAGELYVWSDKIPTPEKIAFGNGATGATNGFTAVYSGYNHNIFAITELGKLIRVSLVQNEDKTWKYVQTVYDSFNRLTGSGSATAPVTNWSVDSADIKSSQKSVVKFEIPVQPNKEQLDPEIGSITLFVNNAMPTQTSISLNGVRATATEDEIPVFNAMTYAGRARESLVSSNATGDVYRILGATGDENIRYLQNTNGVYAQNGVIKNVALSADDIKPQFSFKAKGTADYVVMDPDQWKLLFSYEIVDDANYGTGIKITPKRSTQNGTVNVSFYVARYDCDDNPATATYYDYSRCNVEFTVDNSEAVRMYEAFDVDNADKSAIPLLDPGNPYNKYYSLALQNVSGGFEALSGFISQQNADELVTRIKNYISADKRDALSSATLNWDPGYPSTNKIAAGNLKYYLGAKVERLWYSGEYKYLFADRDFDVVKLRAVNSTDPSNTSIAASIKTILVKLTGLATGETALTNKIAYSADLLETINKKFENVYGITNINVKAGAGDDADYVDEISFSYDVLLFTANGTTGKLDYGENPTVDSFNTIKDTVKNGFLSYGLAYDEYTTFTKDFIADISNTADKVQRNTWQTAAAVFSQASVRLKDPDESGRLVYGAAKDNAELGIVANNHLTVRSSSTLYVGSDDIVINLTDYVQSPGAFISFSYKNNRVDPKPFTSQFIDSVTGQEYISLSGDKITIKLLSAHDIKFTVSIQRFFGAGSPATSYFENGDERVTIRFEFTGIKDVPFGEVTDTAGDREFEISRAMKVYVFGPNTAPESERANVINEGALVSLTESARSKMTMSEPRSNNYDVLDVTKESESVLSVTPGESGRAVVYFTLTVYGKSVPITLTFNVSGITNIKDKDLTGEETDYTVNLSDVARVYINTLTTGLTNAVGDFIDVDDFGVLYDDKTTGADGKTQFAGVYFEKVGDKAREGEGDDGEVGLDTYLPPFVKDISFYDTGTDKAYLRFDIDSDATADQLQGEYNVYVKFVDKSKNYKTYADAAGDTVLRAAFKLKANKKVAFENGAMLEIVADVDKPKKEGNDKGADWYMTGSNTEAKIYVPIRYLCSKVGIPNYDEYEIFLVSIIEGNAGDINPVGGSEATRDTIEITPINSTKAPITLNVSISNKTKGQAENQVIAFKISVKGISTTLSKSEYTTIWLVAFFGSLGLLMIVFLIRMIVYWRRRAKQRALIKRNQELIKMRDRVHNKATSATREQAIRTKLKLQDPKYAKMLQDMKKDQNGGIGVSTVDDFGVASSAAAGAATGKKGKKKKGGKKSMAELKAELAAKKAAFAQAQSGADPMTFGAQPVNPFEGGGFGGQAPDFGGQPPEFGAQTPDFGSPTDMFSASDLDGNSIIFDAPDNDGGQG